VRFGRVEPFDFTAEDGTLIEGLLYYPLDFDPAQKYPLLTYYYGGVVPTDRSFGGRYPKNLWAANGYAVYVLQPSGAVGWGQEMSARHVNDWGRRVSGEIQQGVRAVLAAQPFLDGARVGNFGGSYGGFLTLLLLTESDQFAAAISHAGISAIPSYWGEGWWGYLYNAVSAAGSYPWNQPDLYVEQSPLFAADRIDAPLLLLHGSADPNVPPGESEQMFAALRVLGKEVELIRIEGEAHWILTYPKRVLWWQTVLAWFDMHLKGEPEWWEELWGEPVTRTGP
jgi:dipeptidyl aminopeptidase/acylaminoacyl peptidase